MKSRPPVLRTALLILALFIVLALVMPVFPNLSQLNTQPDAAQVRVSLLPSATPPKSSPTPVAAAPTTSEESSESAETVEVIVTVKETATEEPEEETPAVTPWEIGQNLETGVTLLKLVVINEGDLEIQPCLVIPAIYDREGVPVRIQSAAMRIGAGAEPGTEIPLKIGQATKDTCHTGIRSQPRIQYDYKGTRKIILPGRSETFTFILRLATSSGVSFTGLPYNGRVDVYIPGAPPNDEEKTSPKFLPYQSLPFTVQSIPLARYALAWKSLRDWAVPVLTALLELLAVFLVVLLLGFYGPPLLRSLADDPKLTLDAIQSQEEDKKISGEKLQALLEDEIDRFRGIGNGQNFSPSLAGTGNMPVFDIQTKLSEQAILGTIIKILEYIFKPKTIKVTGQLQNSTEKGAGLTVKLTDSRTGEIFGTETFWEVDYCGLKRLVASSADPVFDPNALLVQAAATWICCAASDHLGKTYAPLGSSIWQSNAYCVCALHMFGLTTQKNAPKDAKLRAIDLFHTALSHDHNNPVAAINHTRLIFEAAQTGELSDGEKRLQYQLAQDRFKRIVETLQQAPQTKEKKISPEELWLYQARYNRAAVMSLQAQKTPNTGEADVLGQLLELGRLLESKVVDLTGNTPAAPPSTPPGETMPESIDGMREAIFAIMQRIQNAEARLEREQDRQQIRGLRQAITTLVGLMQVDLHKDQKPDPDFASFLSSLDHGLAEINDRVHYDVACYFAIGAKNDGLSGDESKSAYEHALFHLEQALEQPGDLSNLARKDPDLNNLRNSTLKKRFDQIVNRHTEDPAAQSDQPEHLEDVLQSLREPANVTSAEELLRSGTDRAERQGLARASAGKLTYEMITKWVHIADLMRATGGDELYATFLYRFVDSPAELSSIDQEAVIGALRELIKERNLHPGITAQQLVSNWVGAAADLEPVVF